MIERSLYHGKFKMVHNPDAKGSSPRYKVNSTEKPKGVTTIMSKVLAKDLVGWAISCATAYLEEKLPVITKADLEEASKAYTWKRDAGANTGSEAHKLVEDFLKGKEVDLEHASIEAQNAFGAFKEWFDMNEPEVINVEEVIYSDAYGYAGTYDCMLRVHGKVYLCDLKTTNSSRVAPRGVYAEYFVQLGAYAGAHEEQRVFETDDGGTNLVPIDGLMVISAKKNGKLDVITNEDVGLTLEDCVGAFHRVMGLFNFITHTTKQLGGR